MIAFHPSRRGKFHYSFHQGRPSRKARAIINVMTNIFYIIGVIVVIGVVLKLVGLY